MQRVHVQGEARDILEEGSILRGNIKGILLLLFPIHTLAVAGDGFLSLSSLILAISVRAMNDIEEMKLK